MPLLVLFAYLPGYVCFDSSSGRAGLAMISLATCSCTEVGWEDPLPGWMWGCSS